LISTKIPTAEFLAGVLCVVVVDTVVVVVAVIVVVVVSVVVIVIEGAFEVSVTDDVVIVVVKYCGIVAFAQNLKVVVIV